MHFDKIRQFEWIFTIAMSENLYRKQEFLIQKVLDTCLTSRQAIPSAPGHSNQRLSIVFFQNTQRKNTLRNSGKIPRAKGGNSPLLKTANPVSL